MSGLGLWIAENVWAFLIAGLLLSVALGAWGARLLRRARRRVRHGEVSRWALAAPLAVVSAPATASRMMMASLHSGACKPLGEIKRPR